MHFHVIALPHFTVLASNQQTNISPPLSPTALAYHDFGQKLAQNQNFIEAKTFGMSAENVFWGRATKTHK